MQSHRRQPTRLPHPWDSPGKNTGVGCHFLLQCMKVKSESEVAQSCPTLRPHGLQPSRLLHPWDFPGKNTGVGCHRLLRSFLHILIFISHIYLYSLAYWALTGWKFWLSNSVILRTIRNFFYLFDHKNVLNYEFPQKTCILSLKIYLLFIALLMYRKTLLNHRCDFLYTSVPPKDYLVIILPII